MNMAVCTLSVVICTYRRPEYLRLALDSLASQTAPRTDWEVLVVDNAGEEAVRTLADATGAEYVHEPRVGLSSARNSGWRCARGRYVAYVDDDCRMPPVWVDRALEIARAGEMAAFGGPYVPFYLTPPPRWFKDEYGSHSLSAVARDLAPGEYLDGGNLFVQRAVLEQLDGFSTELGMRGEELAYGEETALQDRIRKVYPRARIYYDPALQVEHLVAPHKMTVRWIACQRFEGGRSMARVQAMTGRAGQPRFAIVRQVARCGLILAADFVQSIAWRDRRRFPFRENQWYEQTFDQLVELGRLYELFRRQRASGSEPAH